MLIAVIASIVLAGDEAEAPVDDVQAPTPAPTATASTSPTPTAFEPTFAPDGRTGIAELDQVIDEFVGMSAEELATTYADVPGRAFDGETDEILTASEWAERLTSAERSLFAVLSEREGSSISPPRQFNIILSVTEPEADEAGWGLAIERGKIVDLAIGRFEPLSHTGEVGFNYERFLVLPPRDELPRAPPAHALSTRTGIAGVDSLIAILEAHDRSGLATAGVEPVVFSRCRVTQPEREEVATRRLDEVAQQAMGIHAVTELPEGYLPTADHMIIVVMEVSLYLWSLAALIESGGAVVGFDLCSADRPAYVYPPLSYPAPTVADVADLDAARRSGIGPIDAFLDALAVGDLETMLSLIDYEQVGCVTEQAGIGGPPLCGEGEPEGTVLDVVISAQCEGHYVRQEEIGETLGLLFGVHGRCTALPSQARQPWTALGAESGRSSWWTLKRRRMDRDAPYHPGSAMKACRRFSIAVDKRSQRTSKGRVLRRRSCCRRPDV